MTKLRTGQPPASLRRANHTIASSCASATPRSKQNVKPSPCSEPATKAAALPIADSPSQEVMPKEPMMKAALIKTYQALS